MIVERLEQLFALIQGEYMLSHPGWSNVTLTTALPLGMGILGLVLIVDYGYMIYLHFRMASSRQHQINNSLIAALTIGYSHQAHFRYP